MVAKTVTSTSTVQDLVEAVNDHAAIIDTNSDLVGANASGQVGHVDGLGNLTNVRDELRLLDQVSVRYVATKAAADAIVNSLVDGTTVIVESDETQFGQRFRYTVASQTLTNPILDASIQRNITEQKIVATAGQTIFNLSTNFTVNGNTLAVFLNGVRLTKTDDYTESSASSITLALPADSGDVLNFIIGSEVNVNQLTAAIVNAQNAQLSSEAARDAALLSRGVFPSTAAALSKGVVNLASLVGGSGGANGTFDLAFTGGGGTGAAGVFVVAGGTVVSFTITANGNGYTTAPAVSFAASAGLTGASATAVIANNTDSGEYFSVPQASPNSTLLDLYLNNAGVAQLVNSYPATQALAEVEQTQRLLNEQANVFSVAQLSFDSLPLLVGGTVVASRINGLKAVLGSSDPATGESRFYWRFPVTSFPSGKLSAQITIESATAGTTGNIRIIQRNSAGTQVALNSLVTGLTAAITSPQVYKLEALDIVATATIIDLDVQFINANGDKVRTVYARSPMLADGVVSFFRQPPVGDPKSGISENRFLAGAATDVQQKVHNLPLALASIAPSGTITPTASSVYENQAYSINVSGNVSSSLILATQLDTAPLVAGEVVRLSAIFTSSNTTSSLGLGFGSASSVTGFALRTTAQLLTLSLPGNTTGAAVGPAALPYVAGDRLVIDARLVGGAPGNYTVDYYVEYSSGQRFGPYTVNGINSIDSVWFMQRSSAVFSDVRLTRHKVPRYASELLGNGSSAAKPAVVYVSPTGNDNNTGLSSGSPFASFSKAIDTVAPGGIVELAGGEYRQTLNLGGVSGYIWIRAEKDKRAMIFGSNQLVLTKTAGFTQVYQSPLAQKPTGIGDGRGQPMIFEFGTKSKLILEADRHDLQRGETHRLPYTEMLEAASIAELDTVGGRGKWFYESGVIYLAAVDGGDATLKRYEVRARECVNAIGGGSVKLTRLDAFFSSGNGMTFRTMVSVEREECRAFGAFRNGFSDDCNVIKSYRDESAGNGNDGFNGTAQGFAGTGNREVMNAGSYFEPYGHDNFDDGISYHTRGECAVYGGMFEFNTKAGVVHVTGASCSNYNTISRYNGNGFYAATAPGDGRVTSVLRTHGCIAYGNDYNFRAADGVLLAFDSVSSQPNIFGYHQAGTGKVEARNCKNTGDPLKVRSGNVIVITDNALV